MTCSGIRPLNPNKQDSRTRRRGNQRQSVWGGACVCRPEPSCQSLNVSVSAPVLTARMPNGQIRWAHEDSEGAFSRGNLVETRRQMQGQLSVKTYKLSRRGWGKKSGWTHPPHPIPSRPAFSSPLYPSTPLPPIKLPPSHTTSATTQTFLPSPKMPRQRCTKTSRHFAPNPPFVLKHTDTHAGIHLHASCQSATKRVSCSHRRCQKEKGQKRWRKGQLLYYSLSSLLFHSEW